MPTNPLLALCVVALTLLPVPCRGSDVALPPIAANDNRVSAGKLDNRVLMLHLEVREGQWHPGAITGPAISPQIPITVDTAAFGEAGRFLQMPGPLIRAPQGTEVHVSVRVPHPCAGAPPLPGFGKGGNTESQTPRETLI